jgi:hypothetical protein
MIEKAGLKVEEIADVPPSALKSERVSPKLLTRRGPTQAVITAYRVRK